MLGEAGKRQNKKGKKNSVTKRNEASCGMNQAPSACLPAIPIRKTALVSFYWSLYYFEMNISMEEKEAPFKISPNQHKMR